MVESEVVFFEEEEAESSITIEWKRDLWYTMTLGQNTNIGAHQSFLRGGHSVGQHDSSRLQFAPQTQYRSWNDPGD